MLEKLNPFKKPRPNNPLESLSEDDLRTGRKKLEFNRDRILKQVREMEAQKIRLMEEGAQHDLRVRKDKAYQIKAIEEQIQQLDYQLTAISRQVQFLNRLAFLKQNSAQVGQLVIDELMGKLDTSKLRVYIEDITVRGTAGADRLDELVAMFDESWVNVAAGGEDPDIARILEELERMSMPALPDIKVEPGAVSGEAPARQNNTTSSQ